MGPQPIENLSLSVSLPFLVVTVSTHKQVFSTRVFFPGPAFLLLLGADGAAGEHPNILPECRHFISLRRFLVQCKVHHFRGLGFGAQRHPSNVPITLAWDFCVVWKAKAHR